MVDSEERSTDASEMQGDGLVIRIRGYKSSICTLCPSPVTAARFDPQMAIKQGDLSCVTSEIHAKWPYWQGHSATSHPSVVR